MGEYDLTMKRLTAEFAEDYVRFVLGRAPSYAEVLEIEEMDKELPSLMREVDFAVKVEMEGKHIVLLVEFQTRWEGDVPQRMMGYCWRLYERYGFPVYPVVMVFREGGVLKDGLEMRTLEMEVIRFRFRVVPVWEVEGSGVVDQRLMGLYPLLPLMRWEGRRSEEVLEESQRLVLGGIEERERRADAYVALRVLSGIRYPLELIHRILRRRDIMLESPVYREILEEGRELGRREGIEVGEEARLREDVLEVLEVRFGEVPSWVKTLVGEVREKKALERLHRRAIVVEDLEAFRDADF